MAMPRRLGEAGPTRRHISAERHCGVDPADISPLCTARMREETREEKGRKRASERVESKTNLLGGQ